MKLKTAVLVGIIFLFLASTILAQEAAPTRITLQSPVIEEIGTTLNVTPVLSWLHETVDNEGAVINPNYQLPQSEQAAYGISISTDPTFPEDETFQYFFSGSTGFSPSKTITLPAWVGLEYDTMYYWQVRQYYGYNSETNVWTELPDPSNVGSFQTPSVSVKPSLSWEDPNYSTLNSSGNVFLQYQVRLSKDSSFPLTETLTENGNLSFGLTLTTNTLEYNTTYYWQWRKQVPSAGDPDVGAWPTGGWSATTYSFTTKPLVVLAETYEISTNSGTTWSSLPINHPVANGNQIRYTAFTDEFEFNTGQAESVFSITSIVADPDRAPVALNYAKTAASGQRTVLTQVFTLINATADDADADEIKLTNSDIITLAFVHGGAPFTVVTPPTAPAAMTALNVNISSSVEPITWEPQTDPNIPNTTVVLQILLAASAPPAGTSQVVTIKNMENGDSFTKTAFPNGSAYVLQLTAAEIQSFYHATDPNKVNQNRPIRISFIPERNEDLTKDFIWHNRSGITPALLAADQAMSISFSSPEYNRFQNIVISGYTAGQWVRLVSDTDPVGIFVFMPATPTPEIFIGEDSDPTKTPPHLAAGVGDNVYAVSWTLNPPFTDSNVIATTEIISQEYSPFWMMEPGNQDEQISLFTRFEWSPGSFQQERNGNTHYWFQITDTPNMLTTSTTPGATGGDGWYHSERVVDNVLYLKNDLEFNTMYYWRVDIQPSTEPVTADNSIPINLVGANTPYWQFRTDFRPDPEDHDLPYRITGLIAADRVLRDDVNYEFYGNVTIAEGATLTIPAGQDYSDEPYELSDYRNRDITIADDTNFIIYGNLIIEGLSPTNRVNIVPANADSTWSGFTFVGPNDNSDSPLVVDEGVVPVRYVEGGSYFNYVTISGAVVPINIQDRPNLEIFVDNTIINAISNGIVIGDGSYVLRSRITFKEGEEYTRAIDGGYYFYNANIDGIYTFEVDDDTVEQRRLNGDGIYTTHPNARIYNSEIINILGNAIHVNAPRGNATIQNNIVRATGTWPTTRVNNVAIWANPGAIVSGNTIGNFPAAYIDASGNPVSFQSIPTANQGDLTHRNAGYGIRNGAIIHDNRIAQNGNGAIEADFGAQVTQNKIFDNHGAAIVNGSLIQNNIIFNSATVILEEDRPLRTTNAILADINPAVTVTVSHNSIYTVEGYAILNGMLIATNMINNANIGPSETPLNQFAIRATANAHVEGNNISNIIGPGIENGATIISNIIEGSSATQDVSFGILANIDATVRGNTIRNMAAVSIQNGLEIHQNTIEGGVNGILAQANSLVIDNTLDKSKEETVRLGYAIRNGLEINLNTVSNYVTDGENIVESLTVQRILENTMEYNLAMNASILSVERTNALPLEIIQNIFTDNQYTRNTLRISSAGLLMEENVIMNNAEKEEEANPNTGIHDFINGGPIGEYDADPSYATAVYLYLISDATMNRNQIVGHKGNATGAALYIDSANVANTLYIADRNTISGNHATGEYASGAAIYHVGGTVYVGPHYINDNYGNTITGNTVPNIAIVSQNANNPVDIETLYNAGSAIHSLANMHINRNIITGNAGNWAVYGAPLSFQFNNIYNNTFDGEDEDYKIETVPPSVIVTNQGRNLRYTGTANLPLANYNFWGTRSVGIHISNSIYHQPNDPTLGLVTFTPPLNFAHHNTPSIVGNIRRARVLASEDHIPTHSSLRTLQLDTTYTVVINAQDNNDYSRDFTQIEIFNQRTLQNITPLMLETEQSSEIYIAKFTLVAPHCIVNNRLPAQDGDFITFTVPGYPNLTFTIRVSTNNSIIAFPNVKMYDFGDWVEEDMTLLDEEPAAYVEKTFIFTNELTENLYYYGADLDGDEYKKGTRTIGDIDITDIAYGDFVVAKYSIATDASIDLWNLPASGSIIPPGGSFQVVVRYYPETTDDVAERVKDLNDSEPIMPSQPDPPPAGAWENTPNDPPHWNGGDPEFTFQDPLAEWPSPAPRWSDTDFYDDETSDPNYVAEFKIWGDWVLFAAWELAVNDFETETKPDPTGLWEGEPNEPENYENSEDFEFADGTIYPNPPNFSDPPYDSDTALADLHTGWYTNWMAYDAYLADLHRWHTSTLLGHEEYMQIYDENSAAYEAAYAAALDEAMRTEQTFLTVFVSNQSGLSSSDFPGVAIADDRSATIELTGRSIPFWNAPGTRHNFFGDDSYIYGATNQMSIMAQVTIEDETGLSRYPLQGSRLAAYVNNDITQTEELRGIADFENNSSGYITITVNTADAGENIYFKIWEPEGFDMTETPPVVDDKYRLWDTPWSFNVLSVPGTHIGNDSEGGPYRITGKERINLSGLIETANGDPLPAMLVRNAHLDGDPFDFITDSTGYYFIRSWVNSRVILQPHNRSYSFVPSTPQPEGIDDEELLIPNFDPTDSAYGSFDYNDSWAIDLRPATGEKTIIPENSVYVNVKQTEDFPDGDSEPLKGLFDLANPFLLDNYADLHFIAYNVYNIFAGIIYFDEAKQLPYENGGIRVVTNNSATGSLTGDTPEFFTNEFGYFYVPIIVDHMVHSVHITNQQFIDAGYSDVQSLDTMNRTTGVLSSTNTLQLPIEPIKMDEDKWIALPIVLTTDNPGGGNPSLIERTQNIPLRRGWNLISFNVDHEDPSIAEVFRENRQFNELGNGAVPNVVSRIAEVRTPRWGFSKDAFDSSLANANSYPIKYYDTRYPESDGGYFVRVGRYAGPDGQPEPTQVGEPTDLDDVNNILFRLTDTPRYIRNVSLRGKPAASTAVPEPQPALTLVGYIPGRTTQTRPVVNNDEDITWISSDTESYYHTENIPGVSNLRYMEPGRGFWMANDSESPETLQYNMPGYSDVIKHLIIYPVDDLTDWDGDGRANQSHAIGVIDNEFLGLPYRDLVYDAGVPAETHPDVQTDYVVRNQLYRIVTADPEVAPNAAEYRTFGAVQGRLGEVFVATRTGYLTGDNEVLNLRGPKVINIELSEDETNADLIGIVQTHTADRTFEVASQFIMSHANYDALMAVLHDAPPTRNASITDGRHTRNNTVATRQAAVRQNSERNTRVTRENSSNTRTNSQGTLNSSSVRNNPDMANTRNARTATQPSLTSTRSQRLFGGMRSHVCDCSDCLSGGSCDCIDEDECDTKGCDCTPTAPDTSCDCGCGTCDPCVCDDQNNCGDVGCDCGVTPPTPDPCPICDANGCTECAGGVCDCTDQNCACTHDTPTVPDQPEVPELNWEDFITQLSEYSVDSLDNIPFAGVTTRNHEGGVVYMIFSDKDLGSGSIVPEALEAAIIVVYRISFNVVEEVGDPATPVRTLNSIAFVNNYDETTGSLLDADIYQAVPAGENEFIIAIPADGDVELVNPRLIFDITGGGMYTGIDSDGEPVGDQLFSGSIGYNKDSDDKYIVAPKETYRFFVANVDDEVSRDEIYTVHLVRLPKSAGFDFGIESARRTMPPAIPPMANFQTDDPFGDVKVLTSNHLVVARIENKGNPIPPGHTLAAYINGELRGKAEVIDYLGHSYAMIVVNTTTMNQEISFRIHQDIWGERVEYLTKTLKSIPGGTTGYMADPFIIPYDFDTDIDDLPPVTFENQLHQNYPNPFNPTTTIRFSTKNKGHASIVVYNIRGQRVATLVDEEMEAGNHQVIWNGVSDTGRQSASGVYFIRMNTDGFTKVNRAVLMK